MERTSIDTQMGIIDAADPLDVLNSDVDILTSEILYIYQRSKVLIGNAYLFYLAGKISIFKV